LIHFYKRHNEQSYATLAKLHSGAEIQKRKQVKIRSVTVSLPATDSGVPHPQQNSISAVTVGKVAVAAGRLPLVSRTLL